jgi:hypothetical protein
VVRRSDVVRHSGGIGILPGPAGDAVK